MRKKLSFKVPKGFSMKRQTPAVQLSCLLILSFFLSSCVPDKGESEANLPDAPPAAPVEYVEKEAQLPVQYQNPSYMVDTSNSEDLDEVVADVALKVGASIRSTQGPQPLWDILKRLAALKKMSVSWASDVDKDVLVDVDISAKDDFYKAINNLLRQVDYYHEMEGSTIVVHYKETRQFHIAMPFLKQTYKTNVGGDVLGGNGELGNTNISGEISLSSEGVALNNTSDGKPGDITFDTWYSIENNLNAILNIWTTNEVEAEKSQGNTKTDFNHKNSVNKDERDFQTDSKDNTNTLSATFRRSAAKNTYFIDKPVGLITVTAPRLLLDKLDNYFTSLKRELYKQISIEAKIIEVHLNDHSSIGLNWNMILKNLSVGANYAESNTRTKTITDGNNSSENWTRTITDTRDSSNSRSRTFDHTLDDTLTADTGADGFTNAITDVATSAAASGVNSATTIAQVITGGGAAAVSLAAFTMDTFLNAVKEQGQTTILSNPKLSVLNGQPALITVGRNVTYIDEITSDVDGTSGTVTYTAKTERVLSGIGLALTANILDDKEIILNLVPVTSELEEPIEYRDIGLGQVGLPVINVREMSTTVRVKDGEMLVIGGLISNVDDSDGTFIPGTSNIPFFKYFFGYEEKTSRKRELIILLKPKII